MKTKTPSTAPDPAHRDPITGEPGTHMLGTSVGAVAVGAVGTALGVAVAGPVGGLVGAAIGPMLGGLAGHEIAETMDPTVSNPNAAEEEHEHPLLDKIESVPIHRDSSEAETTAVDLDPLFRPSVKAATAAAAAQTTTDPIEQRATEIARRQGRHQVAESDRRRAFIELRDEGATV